MGPNSGEAFDVLPAEAERFWQRVQKGDGCWLWTGVLLKGRADAKARPLPYGLLYLHRLRRPISAHRVSFRINNGPIPPGLCVMHMCDNPPCVNPAHLVLGTQADNMRDAAQKGRMPGSNATKTHCRYGHAFTPENTRLVRAGRSCLACEDRRRHEPSRRLLDEFRALVAETVEPVVPASASRLALLIGERHARVLSEFCGLYGEVPRPLTDVGAGMGITRERARQIRNAALVRLGVDAAAFDRKYPAPLAARAQREDHAAALLARAA